jgi:FkbM family methyltransferase
VSPEEVELYKLIIPSCKCVFDVGCQNDNIFYEINPNADIHLFDPELNSALSVQPGIKYNNIALGSKKEVVDFHYHYGSILLRDNEDRFNGHHQSKRIYVDTIFNYCKDNKIKQIDYLKIDTEGYDFEVIKGAGKLINKIKYIQFEEWDTGMDAIMDFFKGYNVYIIDSYPRNFLATKETISNLTKFNK